MTDAELGTRIVQAVERLKRAKAEAAALWTDATEKRAALREAGDSAGHLMHDPERGRLALHSTGEAAKAWPSFEEVAAAFKRHHEKDAEVDELRDAVKKMTGLDRELLS